MTGSRGQDSEHVRVAPRIASGAVRGRITANGERRCDWLWTGTLVLPSHVFGTVLACRGVWGRSLREFTACHSNLCLLLNVLCVICCAAAGTAHIVTRKVIHWTNSYGKRVDERIITLMYGYMYIEMVYAFSTFGRTLLVFMKSSMACLWICPCSGCQQRWKACSNQHWNIQASCRTRAENGHIHIKAVSTNYLTLDK